MGAPQFMPSNYRRYAVDADEDGRIDLWTNWPDVFASIGNYLTQFGWISGEPVLATAAADPARADPARAATVGRKLALSDTVGSLTRAGVRLRHHAAGTARPRCPSPSTRPMACTGASATIIST